MGAFNLCAARNQGSAWGNPYLLKCDILFSASESGFRQETPYLQHFDVNAHAFREVSQVHTRFRHLCDMDQPCHAWQHFHKDAKCGRAHNLAVPAAWRTPCHPRATDVRYVLGTLLQQPLQNGPQQIHRQATAAARNALGTLLQSFATAACLAP
jgi:hypothetical protein